MLSYFFLKTNASSHTPVLEKNKPNRTQLKICKICVIGGQKWQKDGVVWDKFGVFLAQFGVILDKFGVVWDYFGSIKTPKKRIYNTKNTENTKFSRLVPSKTPNLQVMLFDCFGHFLFGFAGH